MGNEITVKALDAQRSLKYSWSATLLAREEDGVVLYGKWGRLLCHAQGERVPITNCSIEFYPFRGPYVISVILDRAGKLQEYYGRVISPPTLYTPEKELEFVMLGVDLQVRPNYDYEILDRANEELSEPAQRGLIELVECVERREGPFDREFLRSYLLRT